MSCSLLDTGRISCPLGVQPCSRTGGDRTMLVSPRWPRLTRPVREGANGHSVRHDGAGGRGSHRQRPGTSRLFRVWAEGPPLPSPLCKPLAAPCGFSPACTPDSAMPCHRDLKGVWVCFVSKPVSHEALGQPNAIYARLTQRMHHWYIKASCSICLSNCSCQYILTRA